MLYSEVFERAVDAIGVVRRRVRQVVADEGRRDLDDRVALAVSELTTNALLHGGGETLCVEVAIDAGAVVVTVHDASPMPPVLKHVDADTVGGRGLALVAAVSDSWGYQPTPAGKSVWCRWEAATS